MGWRWCYRRWRLPEKDRLCKVQAIMYIVYGSCWPVAVPFAVQRTYLIVLDGILFSMTDFIHNTSTGKPIFYWQAPQTCRCTSSPALSSPHHQRSLDVELGKYIYIYILPPDPQFLLLVLVQILNVELIVVGKPYCCSVVGVNSNNSNLS